MEYAILNPNKEELAAADRVAEVILHYTKPTVCDILGVFLAFGELCVAGGLKSRDEIDHLCVELLAKTKIHSPNNGAPK